MKDSPPHRGATGRPAGDELPSDQHLAAHVDGTGMIRTSRPTTMGAPRGGPQTGPAPQGRDSSFREIVETVVFVVVLVLLLKTFTAEAFVIPTGSMATTLWGDQKWATCPQCTYSFPVNCHDEVEGRNGQGPLFVTGCTCPNCRYSFDFASPPQGPECNSGDRVLVGKYLYDTGIRKPQRLDVVVFKYPREPQKNESPTNYIKRLIGLPGETVAIYYGKLYVMAPGDGARYDDHDIPAGDRWNSQFQVMHENEASALLKQGDARFVIVRKPPEKILAMRRIVYDNDHPARDLTEPRFARWLPATSTEWKLVEGRAFHHTGPGGGLGWLRYRHLLRGRPGEADTAPRPELITDFMGYNSRSTRPEEHPVLPRNWTGDLIVECEAEVNQAAGRLILELSKGADRYRADWDLASGVCRLVRLTEGGELELARQDTPLKKSGTFRLRFANVDERLVVWVDGRLPFGEGVAYPAPKERGPRESDLQPVSIGAAGADVTIRGLRLWRDTYYTLHPPQADALLVDADWSDPAAWGPLRDLPAKTLFVQPEPRHYLCLGDNSPESSDGRDWGLVPERLLLGRALVVYWPCYFPVWPFNNPLSRVGPIR